MTELYTWQLGLYMKEHWRNEDIHPDLNPYDIFKISSVQDILRKIAELADEMFMMGVAVIEKDETEENRFNEMEEIGLVFKLS